MRDEEIAKCLGLYAGMEDDTAERRGDFVS